MANAYTTLLDIVKANGSDMVTGLIDETITANPEVRVVPARTIRGTNYKTIVRTSLPTAGFRQPNQGAAAVKSTYENRLVDTYNLSVPWICDKSVADRYEDGPEAYIAMEAQAMVRAGLVSVSKQFYYGGSTLTSDVNGFPGLLAGYDNANMCVDAGGTTDNVASSVWAICGGPDKVQWVYGMNGAMDITNLLEMRYPDPADATKTFLAYTQELLAYPGLQIGDLRMIGRIKKLTTDSGKGLTDALIYQLLSLFPAGYVPDALFMTRRSLMQLRQSRTATNPTGAPAPLPTEVEGIPIYVTDSISNIETLAS